MDPMQLLQFLMQQQGTNPQAEQAAALRRGVAPGAGDFADVQPGMMMSEDPNAPLPWPQAEDAGDSPGMLTFDSDRGDFFEDLPAGQVRYPAADAQRMADRGERALLDRRPMPKRPRQAFAMDMDVE